VLETLCALNLTRQSFVALSVRRADTMLSRLRGLLGKRRLDTNDGLWVVPSRGIHTIGLFFSIDVVYLDAEKTVVHLVERLSPLRFAPVKMNAHTLLLLPVQSIYTSRTKVGDKLLICSPEALPAYSAAGD
jgi:uncharacterized membrane protein (UPF0127 family)